MADTDVNPTPSVGATLPPLPSPSAAPASPLPDARMRVNHVQPQAVPASAYQALKELNRGFEQVKGNLQALQGFNFFPAENLTSWANIICNLQATANCRLMVTLSNREMNNALYYDRLCLQRERQLRDPDDVLLDAERRKRELAEEQRREQSQGESE